MKAINYALILFVSFNLLACSSSDSGGGKDPGTDLDPADIGYKPTERWPESGEYSYNFKYTYNGVTCKTEKKFNEKAAYCMGLQDQKLNESCALDSRKRSYDFDCGNDFQEMNFSRPLYISGFDQRKQMNCKVDTAEGGYFKTQKQYCEFLADESRHQECHWDQRLQKFEDLKCPGSFSPEPAVNVPSTPAPAPSPSPTPDVRPLPPQEDPLDRIPVVRELRAAGIKVEVDRQSIHEAERFKRPGDPSLQEKMETLWRELESVKTQLIHRKNIFQTLHITSYTTSQDEYGTLYFAYDTPRGDASKYFTLLDQTELLRRELGIKFDGIHNTTSHREPFYKPLETFIHLLESQKKNLLTMKGIIRTISFKDSYSRFYSKSQELFLKDDSDIERTFSFYLNLLRPLSPVYNWAQNNSVEIEVDFEIEKHSTQIQAVFQALNKEIKNLDLAVHAGLIKGLAINYFADKTTYRDSMKVLSVTTKTSDLEILAKDLKHLGLQAQISLNLVKPINLTISDLGPNYHKLIQLLQGAEKEIRAKSAKIKEIQLGYSTRYYSGLQVLMIGYTSDQSEVSKTIRDIR